MVSARWPASMDLTRLSLLPLSPPSERMMRALRPFCLDMISSEARKRASYRTVPRWARRVLRELLVSLGSVEVLEVFSVYGGGVSISLRAACSLGREEVRS